MKKLLLGLLLFSGLGMAQNVCISETLYLPNGSLFNGLVSISWPVPFKGGDGRQVPPSIPIQVAVKNGVLLVNLEANNTAVPAGTYYQILYRPIGDTPTNATWIVPYSPTCVNLATVQTSSVPSISTTVALTQLLQGGATINQCLIWGGVSWGPANCPGGGGGDSFWTQNSTNIYNSNYSGGTVTVGSNTSPPIHAGSVMNVYGGGLEIGNASAAQSILWFTQNGIERFSVYNETDGAHFNIGRYGNTGLFVDAPLSIIRSTGDLLIGSTSGTDGGFQFDVQKGKVRIFDQTATTGETNLLLKRGAFNTSSKTDLVSLTDGADVSIAGINWKGGFFSTDGTGVAKVAVVGSIFTDTGSVGALDLTRDSMILWNTSSNLNGSFTYDTGLSRISAGLLGLGNGTAGDFSAGLKLTSLTLAGVTGSTQCLQASTAGLVSGTGSACGAGGGGGSGTVNAGTIGQIAYYPASATAVSGASVTGPVKGNGGSGPPTAALGSDIVNLFGGCSGTLLLGADSNCHPNGSGNVPTALPFVAATTGTFSNLGYAGASIICSDNSGNWVMPKAITSLTSSTPTVTFDVAFTGTCYASNGSGAPNATVSFTGQTSVTFTHNLGTQNPIVACYDATPQQLFPKAVVGTSTTVATITFDAATTGSCVANSSGGSTTSGGGGAVASVFGRTGVVVATGGDYTAAQVTNAFDTSANNNIGAHVTTTVDITTPANPSAGSTKNYSKGGKWCSLDSTGTELCVGGTGGGGSVTTVSVKNVESAVPASASGSAYVASLVTVPATINDLKGLLFTLTPDVTNTSATPSLNLNSLGAHSIVHNDGSALVIGELQASKIYAMTYDGTNFQELGVTPYTIGTGLTLTGNTLSVDCNAVGCQGSSGNYSSNGNTFNGSYDVPCTNSATTGTTNNLLAKFASDGTCVIAGTSDTVGAYGVVRSGAGTTGTARVTRNGPITCTADNTVTAGHWAIIGSTTAGRCKDSGSTTYPTAGTEVVGMWQTSGAAASLQTVMLLMDQNH